jgi:hypothetical protein
MVTAKEWVLVALFALFWAGGLPLLRSLRRRDQQTRLVFSSAEFFGLVPVGIAIGIVIIFHSKAFRWPLVLFTVGTFVAGLLAMSTPQADKKR